MVLGWEGVDSVSGEREEILNPATAEVIAGVPRSSKEAVDRAVAAAKTAFVAWSDSTPAERMGMLLRLADRIDEPAGEPAQIDSRNAGTPPTVSRAHPPALPHNLPSLSSAAGEQG